MKFGQLFMYSLGSAGLNAMNFFLVTRFLYFFDPSGEEVIIPGVLAAVALSLGRVTDAVTDPLVGFLSDHTPGRLGRRKSWMLPAIVLLVLSFVFIWYKPLYTGGGWSAFLLLALMANLYFIFYTMYGIPYDAYLAEISESESDRLKVSRYKAVFGIVGIVVAIPFISHPDIFVSGMVLGVVSCLLLLLACLGVREKVQKIKKISYRQYFDAARRDLGAIFSYRSFRYFLLVLVLLYACENIFVKNIEYYADDISRSELCAKGTSAAADAVIFEGIRERNKNMLFGAFAAATIIGLYFWNRRSEKKGKHAVLRSVIFILAFIFPLLLVTGLNWRSFPALESMFYFAMVGFAYAGATILIVVIISDYTDIDTRLTGAKREAQFFGIYAFTRKLGMIVGVMVFALLREISILSDMAMLDSRLPGPVMALICLGALILLGRMGKSDIK